MLMEVYDVKKYYTPNLSLFHRDRNVIKALDGVSFSIEPNEIVGLVGESGCGKSTLSRLLLKLEAPTSGNINFQNEEIYQFRGRKLKAFRKDCQIIFQDTLSSLNPSLCIKNILYEPLLNHDTLSRHEMDLKISKILDRVRLDSDILGRYPLTLSGGERQRVNICRALLLEPKLLVCDEIVSSLDKTDQVSIVKLLNELNRDLDMAILFISHDIELVRFLSQKLLVMQNGILVEVIDNREQAFRIAHPYTQKLFSSLPVKHPEKRNIHLKPA